MAPLGLEGVPDKDLIIRYCSDAPDKEVGEELFRRCLPKIRRFIGEWASKHLYHLPRTVDRMGFLNDAEALAEDKLRRKICSFGFKGSFDGWLRRLSRRAATEEFLKIVGRGPDRRDFVPLEEAFRSKHWPSPFERVRDLQRNDILRSLLAEYAKTSNRRLKCADAIAMSAWEGLVAKEIADVLETTQGYVWRLISHNYSELRQLFVQKLGVTSTKQI